MANKMFTVTRKPTMSAAVDAALRGSTKRASTMKSIAQIQATAEKRLQSPITTTKPLAQVRAANEKTTQSTSSRAPAKLVKIRAQNQKR